MRSTMAKANTISPSSLAILLIALFSLFSLSSSLSLSTKGRWIVDSSTGQRVKLKCVNWVSHSQLMVAEGLDSKPLKDIISDVTKNGFNCVRFTYSIDMFTRHANKTIGDNFDDLDLKIAKAGILKHNPWVLNMTVVEAYDTIIDEMGAQGLMVHIDNHISQSRWCCSLDDGNGFWGDRHFDAKEWLRGLRFVARRFSFKHQVISMSLRNELRGPSTNITEWYRHVADGVSLIHRTNPKLLVVVSGLVFDTDLSFIKTKPLDAKLAENKLVLEAHLYGWSWQPQTQFLTNPLNSFCDKIIKQFVDQATFVVDAEKPLPLFVSEFGYDLSNRNEASNRFMTCFASHLADRDLDWAIWALQGTYYYRNGVQQNEEGFGLLDKTWMKLRNPNITQLLQLHLRTNLDPNFNLSPMSVLHHPLTGKCVEVTNGTAIQLADCLTSNTRWTHNITSSDPEGPIRLVDSELCLKAAGDGLSPQLSTDCTSKEANWMTASQSKFHLASRTERGVHICLEQESAFSDTIVTKRCICIQDDPRCLDDPRSQWFKLVLTNTV